MEYDSLYFLSNKSDSSISNYKVNIFAKAFNFDNCIQHLEETEKLKIIRNKDFNKFIDDNANIYYDDFNDKKPKCDILYRKVNDNYYVDNDKYFEKFTKFYFDLYSSIFPNIGLEKIKLNLNELRDGSKSFGIDFNAIVATAGVNSSTTNNFINENSIEMIFNKNKNDIQTMDDINKAENQVKFIYDNILPIKNEVFIPSIGTEMDLIKNRTECRLSRFNKTMKVENTNTSEIKIKLTKNFNVGSDIGLFANYSSEKHISHDVNFELYFHDLSIPSPEKKKIKKEVNFYMSVTPSFHGPWPTNCRENMITNNIRSLEEAKKIAINFIKEDPENSFIEILQIFSWGTSYTVKQFILEDKKCDIYVGKGRRYVAFDLNNFRDKDHIIKRLEDENYYKNY